MKEEEAGEQRIGGNVAKGVGGFCCLVDVGGGTRRGRTRSWLQGDGTEGQQQIGQAGRQAEGFRR